jgi:hypothetical protein
MKYLFTIFVILISVIGYIVLGLFIAQIWSFYHI